jgi:hypothetical protein
MRKAAVIPIVALAAVWLLIVVSDTRVLISGTRVEPGQSFVVPEWGDLGKAQASQLYCRYFNGRGIVARALWYSPNNFMGRDSCPFLLRGDE